MLLKANGRSCVSQFSLQSLFKNRKGARLPERSAREAKPKLKCSLRTIYAPIVSRLQGELALRSVNFRIALTRPPSCYPSHVLPEFRVVSDARAIRFAHEDKAREVEREDKKRRKKEREKEEGVRKQIEKSSASDGSHISFEVGKPTSRVLTSPSARHNFPENYFTRGKGNPY